TDAATGAAASAGSAARWPRPVRWRRCPAAGVAWWWWPWSAPLQQVAVDQRDGHHPDREQDADGGRVAGVALLDALGVHEQHRRHRRPVGAAAPGEQVRLRGGGGPGGW